MKRVKKKSLNKIIIFQMTLLDRILGICSAIMFIVLPIIGLIFDFEYKFGIIIFLLAMIVYGIFMFFDVFKTYICLDIKNDKLIIRETPGLKKEELDLSNILDIKISDGTHTKEFFTIDINMRGYIRKIDSWSTPPKSRIGMFGRYKMQTKRLRKFCEECNQYLNNKHLK